MKENKGITLIALVITIVVMLILVAVTITMAVNGGLFEYAGRAATKTNEAIKKEQQLASGMANIAGEMVDIFDYATDMITFTVAFSERDEDKFQCKVKKGTTWEEFLSEWKEFKNDTYTFSVKILNGKVTIIQENKETLEPEDSTKNNWPLTEMIEKNEVYIFYGY